MVMGRDSCSKDRGFESRYHILDGHFFTYICCKNCDVFLKRAKINEKESGNGPFLKKTIMYLPQVWSGGFWAEAPVVVAHRGRVHHRAVCRVGSLEKLSSKLQWYNLKTYITLYLDLWLFKWKYGLLKISEENLNLH